MTENAKQAKGEFWNPGLDNRSSSDSKDDKIVEQHEGHKDVKPQQQPQFVLNNPLVNYLHMFSLLQQQQQKNTQQRPYNPPTMVPPFLQLLNANQALNTGIRPPPPQNKIPNQPKKISKVSSTKRAQNPVQTPKVATASNPIVDSVLSNSNAPVNYNCCAICGTAFRLTTDLVAHMRNNHRQSRYKRKLTTDQDEEYQ